MLIYGISFYNTVGGLATEDQKPNRFLFRSTEARGSQVLRDLATKAGKDLQKIFPDFTELTRAVISQQLAEGEVKGSRTDFMRVPLGLTGTRVIDEDAPISGIEVVALFEKGATYGESGINKIRNVFAKSEVVLGSDRRYTFSDDFDRAPMDTFATDFKKTFHDADCDLILPADDPTKWGTDYRELSEFKFLGLSTKQARNQSTSTAQLERELAKRKVKAFLREVKEQEDADGTPFTPEKVVQFFLTTLKALLLAFGVQMVLSVLPAGRIATLVRAAVGLVRQTIGL